MSKWLPPIESRNSLFFQSQFADADKLRMLQKGFTLKLSFF
jgi:hypothetical protein